MNLSRIFANAFARRIAYVVVALVLAWMGIGQARAKNNSPYSDQGLAFAACKADAAAAVASDNAWPDSNVCFSTNGNTAYACYLVSKASGSPRACEQILGQGGNPVYQFVANKTCLSRTGDTPQNNAISVGGAPCINGCAYANSNGTFSTRFDFGTGQSVDFYSAQGMTPTGGVCSGDAGPPAPTCTPDGTIKQCVKDDC